LAFEEARMNVRAAQLLLMLLWVLAFVACAAKLAPDATPIVPSATATPTVQPRSTRLPTHTATPISKATPTSTYAPVLHPTPTSIPASGPIDSAGYLRYAADSLAYCNVHDGYCLHYPRDFEVDENPASDTVYAVLQDPHAWNHTQADEKPTPDVVYVVGPNRSTGADPLRAGLSIQVEAYSSARAMAEVADNYVNSNLRAWAPPGALFTQATTTLGGAPAVWVEGPGRAEEESEYTMHRRLLARYESRLFILRFYPDPEAFPALAEDAEALYRAVAASFTVLPERFPEREPPHAQSRVNAPPGWPPEVPPTYTLDLETWHGPGFSFQVPAHARVEKVPLPRRRAWQLASPATSQIRVLGPLVWVKPGDANWSRSGPAYTLRVRTYENPEALDAEAWARAYLLDSWRQAVEQDRPRGSLPVSEGGEIVEKSVGPAQIAGQPAFRVGYYAFDSGVLAYYVAGDRQIVELSVQLYPLANEPLTLVQRDAYALILSTFRLEEK
jgi:hypothetical protein